MKKLKILIVHNYYQIPGGEDTVVANEKRLLEENGHEVILYARSNAEIRSYGKREKLLMPLRAVYDRRSRKEIIKIIKDKNIDLVHVHNTWNVISPSVYDAAEKCKVPVVQTLHNFRMLCPSADFCRDNKICEECQEKGLFHAVKYRCYRNSAAQTFILALSVLAGRVRGAYRKPFYICLSEFNREKYLELNRRLKKEVFPEDRLFVKPNFTYPAEKRGERDGGYYLFMGRLDKVKGCDLVIRAFARMPELKLVIAGSGPEEEALRALARETGSGNIRFAGFVAGQEKAELLGGARALIVASQWYETFGMVVIEAFAAGIPVIGGNIGNIAALIQDGVTGFLFDYQSPESLAAAVRRFEKDAQDSAWGEKTCSCYQENFTPGKNIRMMEKIYETCLAREAGRCGKQ